MKIPDAMLDVLNERNRQIFQEGWTPEHDDGHGKGELAEAAGCYALKGNPNLFEYDNGTPEAWPWHDSWWKPKDRRRDLVRAAALIVAEIERLDRLAAVLIVAEIERLAAKEAPEAQTRESQPESAEALTENPNGVKEPNRFLLLMRDSEAIGRNTYTRSEQILGCWKLTIGFDTLPELQAAHQAVANCARRLIVKPSNKSATQKENER